MERIIDNYRYSVVKDNERNIIGIVVRYDNERAVLIPLIDIILMMEKIV